MMIRRFRSDDADEWDRFCDNTLNATFLHKRRYLRYHGDRFKDESLIIVDEKGKWRGLFPAARAADDDSCVISHPGITYGGILHEGRLIGEKMLQAMDSIEAFYLAEGYQRLVYKAVPHIYHRAPAQDDLYILFRKGANRFRCDLSAAIDLHNRLPVSSRRRRALRKAQQAGVRVHEDPVCLPKLWEVLKDNLKRKHSARPVHSIDEIRLLAEHFPQQIRFVSGWLDDELVAGIVLFDTGPVHHAQYIASSEQGYQINALDAVFEYCIDAALAKGARWFDFGISNEQQGRYLNNNLYKFKSEFGTGGVVHEFYELNLGKI